MLTLKFGGTSMGSAKRILDSVEIMIGRAKTDRISVIVSAVAGVSNSLQAAIDGCITGGSASTYVESMRKTHSEICAQLEAEVKGFSSKEVLKKIEVNFAELEKLLSGVASFGECPKSIHCRIMGMGELCCVPIVNAVLQAKGQDVIVLDSRRFIFTTGNQAEGDVDSGRTSIAFESYKDGGKNGSNRVVLLPGFVCSWSEHYDDEPKMGLLGRNGSDFSAAVVATCLESSKCEFWTDVDGIYTADPRVVSDAILVEDMTYEEAMQLYRTLYKILGTDCGEM